MTTYNSTEKAGIQSTLELVRSCGKLLRRSGFENIVFEEASEAHWMMDDDEDKH